MNRPRGKKPYSTALVGHLETLRPGEKVIVRDAIGNELECVAATGPVWGKDFAVIWVTRPQVWRVLDGHVDLHKDCIPWPVEDVRRARLTQTRASRGCWETR